MSGATISITPANANPASGSTSRTAQNGTLSVTTDPSPLAIIILDHQMNTVGQGVSPLQIPLAPGLYMVRGTQPGHPDLTQLAWVVSKSNRSVHLSETEPNLVQAAISMVSELLDKYVRKLEPLLPQRNVPSANEPEVRPAPFYIRFCRLKDWSSAEHVELPKFSSNYVRGRAVLEVTNPQQSVVFAQIARQHGSVLNVAIPPAGLRPMRFQLVVCASTDLLAAHVRLSTEWANAAMQYMAQGYLAEAKELVVSGADRERSVLDRVLQKLAKRFDDPAAELVPRYVALRTREVTILNTLHESFLDLFQQYLSDGAVICAETAARERNFKLTAQRIVDIRPGGIPLFTEGFSLLIHRVRELLDLDSEQVSKDDCLSKEQVAKLRDLKRILNKWAPYVQLNSPTVTFSGHDITAPKTVEVPIIPTTTEGWIPVMAGSYVRKGGGGRN